MRRILDSPRRRRRALVGTALVAIAVGLTLALSGGKKHEAARAPAPAPNVPVNPALTDSESVRVPLTRATRRAVGSVVRRFFLSAALRQDVGASYDLATPNFRGGESRRQWATGDIPVPPYPGDPATARISAITGSFRRDVQLLVVLQPRRGRHDDPVAYDVEVKKLGRPGHRRWLVDYVLARQTVAVASSSPPSKDEPDPGIGPHLSARWLLAPLAIAILIVLVPVVLGVREWFRGRRAERLYGKGRSLPPLPSRSEES